MWWCVCDVCFVFIDCQAEKEQRNLMSLQFYLMFVDREGERSVVSFVVFYVCGLYGM